MVTTPPYPGLITDLAEQMTMPSEDRLMRLREVAEMVGLGKSSIYRKIEDGNFPRPLVVGPNVVRWRLSDIRSWINSLSPTSSERHMMGLEMLAGRDGPHAEAVRTSMVDCRRRLNPPLADLIAAHSTAEAAVEAAKDEDVPALYDVLVEARLELLAYRPRSEDEAREKAHYVRSSADCTEDEMGAAVVVSLVDRLCEFRAG